MRKKSNGNWFPYEVVEALSGIKRYIRPDVVNKQWALMVRKLKRAGQELPQENLDADDRGSFNLITHIDEGFEIPVESKALLHVSYKWSTQARGAAKRAKKGLTAIQQSKLSDHANMVRIGMMDKADNMKKAADDNAKFVAVMWKKSE